MRRFSFLFALALIAPLSLVAAEPTITKATTFEICNDSNTATDPSSSSNGTGYFGGGQGTSSDPWLICSRQHLEGINDTSTTKKADYKITRNLDLGGNANPWVPLEGAFEGTLDGNFKTISGLYIDSATELYDDAYYDLFAALDEATIKQLIFDNPEIDSSTYTAPENPGGDTTTGRAPAAGIIAGRSNESTVEDVYLKSPLIQGSLIAAGAVFGHSSYTSDPVNEIMQVHVDNLRIEIISSDNLRIPAAGGLAGIGDLDVTRARVSGSIVGYEEKQSNLGGLLGKGEGESTASEIETDVDFSGVLPSDNLYSKVGGIVGESGIFTVNDVLVKGGAEDHFKGYVGGFAGYYNETEPTNTVVVGDFLVSAAVNNGPIVGGGLSSGDPETGVFYDVNVNGMGSVYGTPVTTADLSDLSTYSTDFEIVEEDNVPSDWSLDDVTDPIWKIDDGNAYPSLIWIDKSLERFQTSEEVVGEQEIYLNDAEDQIIDLPLLGDGDFDNFSIVGLDDSIFEINGIEIKVSSTPLDTTSQPYSFKVYATKDGKETEYSFSVRLSDGSLVKQITNLEPGENSATIGDEIFASAYERSLDVDLLIDSAGEPKEEYVYRITKTPNDDSTSVDLQSSTGYTPLADADEQNDWYVEIGFDPASTYNFNWGAFMCYNSSTDELAIPTNLKTEYSSIEDYLVSGELPADGSAIFRKHTDDFFDRELPFTNTTVGEQTVSNLKGIWNDDKAAFGSLNVVGDCEAGFDFQVLEIWESGAALASKNMTIPETLELVRSTDPSTVLETPSAGVTVGVTGQGLSGFNAALWGLTTIGESAAESGFSAPSPFEGPIVFELENKSVAPGSVVELRGDKFSNVSKLEVAGIEAEISEQSDDSISFLLPNELDSGSQDLVVYSSTGTITFSDYFSVSSVEVDAISTKFWTKQISPNEIKLYAKNIVGAGKVQFFHNGNEVAWVNAQDDSDGKLRVITSGPMTGANYLVRTRELVEGKNVFEIYVDGERVLRRAQGN